MYVSARACTYVNLLENGSGVLEALSVMVSVTVSVVSVMVSVIEQAMHNNFMV